VLLPSSFLPFIPFSLVLLVGGPAPVKQGHQVVPLARDREGSLPQTGTDLNGTKPLEPV